MSGIGDYVHLVALDRPSATPDDPEGGYTPTYLPLDPPTWYCSIQAATARDLERVSGGATTAQATHLIRGPYHPQLTAECRITFRDRVFEVSSVQDRDQQRVDLDVIALELLDTQVQSSRAESSKTLSNASAGARAMTPLNATAMTPSNVIGQDDAG